MREWERQPGETPKAYQAFTLYRDMGPSRSLARIGIELGKTKALMEQWSSRHDWVSRVQAMTDYHEMIRREAVEEHQRASATDEAERKEQLRKRVLAIGEQMAEQAEKMLNYPLTRQTTVRPDKDGEMATYIIEPAKWTKGMIKSLYDGAALAAGEPTSRSDVTGRGEQDFDHANNAAADAALDAFLDAVTRSTDAPDGPSTSGRSELE